MQNFNNDNSGEFVQDSLAFTSITTILFNANVGIFSQSYAIIPFICLLFHYFLSLGSLLSLHARSLLSINGCGLNPIAKLQISTKHKHFK